MDLHTIEMDPAEAEVKYHEYRAAVDQRHDAEDEAIAKGYRELARGNRLISLRKTMRAGGTVPVDFTIWYEGKLHEHQVRVPRLAVIRADAKVVYCDGIRDTGGVTFRMDRWGDSRARRRRVRVPDTTFEALRNRPHTVSAMVPLVPAACVRAAR